MPTRKCFVDIEELRQRKPPLRKREKALNSQLQSLDARAMEQDQSMELSMKIEDFLKHLTQSAKTSSVLERQKVVRLVIKEVLVGTDKITIKHSIPITAARIKDHAEASGTSEKKTIDCVHDVYTHRSLFR